jgi:hypothetical protein
MAIKRYTHGQNVRFEVHVVKLLDEALQSEWCKNQEFNRSDLIRHLVRTGLSNFLKNQPSNKEFITPLERDISQPDESERRDLFGDG